MDTEDKLIMVCVLIGLNVLTIAIAVGLALKVRRMEVDLLVVLDWMCSQIRDPQARFALDNNGRLVIRRRKPANDQTIKPAAE